MNCLEKLFQSKSRDQWVKLLSEARLMALPINDLSEAFSQEQAKSRNLVWDVPHPTLGEVPLLANALQHMSLTPAKSQGHPPLLGEHTFEVFKETLGLENWELQELENKGIIQDSKSSL